MPAKRIPRSTAVGGDAGHGDTVSFDINGTTYSTTVDPGNTFSISVAGSDLAADASFDATVTGFDSAGNPFSASTTSTQSVDLVASATITVDNIIADDVLQAAETGGSVAVTGTVGGDAAPGDTVSFILNGNNYSGMVNAGNGFSIIVSGADLAADTSFDVTVSGSDAAGNPFSATTTSSHSVIEGGNLNVGTISGVLSNDADPDGSPINVAQYATDNTGAGAVVVDGVTTIATALGGSVVVNADGSFTYTAPASLD
ncbi:MAG: Ig-like domain-containing protein, partial [Gammaproteobacteria bacterium]